MPQNLSAQFVCLSPKVWDTNENRLHWASVVFDIKHHLWTRYFQHLSSWQRTVQLFRQPCLFQIKFVTVLISHSKQWLSFKDGVPKKKMCVLLFTYAQNDQIFILSLFKETYNHVHFNIKKCFLKSLGVHTKIQIKVILSKYFFSWTNFIPLAFLLIIKL